MNLNLIRGGKVNKETQAVIENISRIIEGWRKDYIPYQHQERLQTIEKFLLNIEDYKNE